MRPKKWLGAESSHASLNIHSHVKQHNLTLLTLVVPWTLKDASYVTYRVVECMSYFSIVDGALI